MPTPSSRTAPAPGGRIAALVLAGVVVAALAVVAALRLGGGEAEALPAPGLAAPVDAAGLVREAHLVVPAVLERTYAAFGEAEEDAIYDGLASVAAGPALEALYLERAGALAEGGLPDQVVHELRLIAGSWREEGGAVRADVRWAVLGEVGHAEHTHMRGNAYGADLLFEPAGGAWRLTGFELTDVDRSEAGTLTTLAEPGAEAETGTGDPPG